jgi:basic amino acid/polyamine antiporter, APA family
MAFVEDGAPHAPGGSLLQRVLQRKPVGVMTAETGVDSGHGELARNIGLFQLTLFGVGATIGTGIFIVLTQAVPVAGPAVVWSFVIAGAVAGFTAICYAELASAVPVSGSSYSYAYATLGEGVAMIVAACLLLEYGVSAAAVAVGWSQYLNELFDNLFHFTIPTAFAQAPEQGGIINVPAVVLIVLCTLLLLRGASESAKVNAAMVLIKVAVLILFIAVGLQGWESDNLSNFAPFGLDGITSAAGIIFFSFIGLDAVSTAGEEVKNPRRNMPLAIIFALLIVTGLYVAVTIVAVAAQPFGAFEGQDAGLSAILESVTGSTWPATILAAGAVISIFSVTLVVLYGQSRILFAMARDGMIPEFFHRIDPRTLTPVRASLVVAVVVSLLAGLVPINFLAEMTSIGTLTAFLIVSIGVMVLRRRAPDLPRGFKVPLYPLTPILSIAGCIWIIRDLRAVTIWVFFIWSGVALIWYFLYGQRHSALRRGTAATEGSA